MTPAQREQQKRKWFLATGGALHPGGRTYPLHHGTPFAPGGGSAHPGGSKPPFHLHLHHAPKPGGHHIAADVVVNQHIGQLRNALMARGYDPASAARLSKSILSQPGVRLGQKFVFYKGQHFTPEAFAKSRFVQMATGELAKRQNAAAIQADAGYQQAIAQLGLARDQTYAGLDDQRRRSILQFGDPSFAGNDPLLAGQARSNPFSTANLMAQQYAANQRTAAANANQAGTVFGGGYVSGQQGAARQNALSQSEGTQALTDLLSSLSQQKAMAGQQYGIGQQSALSDTTQRLLQGGALHAATPPQLGIGRFRYRNNRTGKTRLI